MKEWNSNGGSLFLSLIIKLLFMSLFQWAMYTTFVKK
jgi:hypothetical protein